MKIFRIAYILMMGFFVLPLVLHSQEDEPLILTGLFFSDSRFLLEGENDWVWNENRLSLRLDQRLGDRAQFHSEVWLRTIGTPKIFRSSHLYNKGITDPLNMEMREAYITLRGFLLEGLDVTAGRQRIAWGTADKLGPTDLLNPADMEDLLDFGRRRGSDAVSAIFYPSPDLSIQAIYVPRFSPANLPTGVFSTLLKPTFVLPMGMEAGEMTDTLMIPPRGLIPQATMGIRVKGFLKGIDLSASFQRVRDGLPYASVNTLSPSATPGMIDIHTQLSFATYHVAGLDIATSIAGAGVWAEAALFFPTHNVTMRTDLTPLFPGSPGNIFIDSLLAGRKEPYGKWLIGCDYHFANNTYLNIQFLKGFLHEQGRGNLDNYLFIRYDISLSGDKLKIAPVSGALITGEIKSLREQYSVIYMPEISWQPNQNTTVSLAAAIFHGRGDGMFSRLNDYSQIRVKAEYFF